MLLQGFKFILNKTEIHDTYLNLVINLMNISISISNSISISTEITI